MVVDDHHLDRQSISGQGPQLLDVHQDAGIAGNADHLPIRAGHLSAHGGGHAESHRSQTSTADPAPGSIAQVLGCPHLVLTDVGGDDRLGGEIPDGHQHLLGIDGALRGGTVSG